MIGIGQEENPAKSQEDSTWKQELTTNSFLTCFYLLDIRTRLTVYECKFLDGQPDGEVTSTVTWQQIPWMWVSFFWVPHLPIPSSDLTVTMGWKYLEIFTATTRHIHTKAWPSVFFIYLTNLSISLFFPIVALNFQTAGLEMDLNDGLFAQNGCCGYILKPDFMRDANTKFSPDKPEERPDYRPLRLSIQVQTSMTAVSCWNRSFFTDSQSDPKWISNEELANLKINC